MDKIDGLLPDFLIADLYKNSLVEVQDLVENAAVALSISSKTIRETAANGSEVKYLGENKKNILIVVRESDAVYINENDLQFLTNILRACNLNLADIAIVNVNNQPVIFNDIKETLSAKVFLLFGMDPTDIKLPFEIPQFQVKHYAGCTICTAPPLSQMNMASEESIQLKRKLWTSLQLCFNLKSSSKK